MNQKTSQQLIYNSNSSIAFSLVDRVALRVRERIYTLLANLVNLDSLDSILDVGVTSDQSCLSSNYFESLYPHKERITALSDQPAQWLEDYYPGIRFVQGDGCHLPFADDSFDLVFSSAVWEHVGNRANQEIFLSECFRVARRYVLITTPNRWHPIEFHTAMPLLHWLPKNLHMRYLHWLSYGTLLSQGKLNLLTRKDIRKMVTRVGSPHYAIHAVKFMGIQSNLLLFLDKS